MIGLRRRSLLQASAIGALALGAPRRAGAAESGPIRIGAALPLSGPIQLLGKDLRIGAELAAEMINKSGGVLGRPIEVVFADTKGSPQEATAQVRDMMSGGIRHLIGGTLTGEALALGPVVQSGNAMVFTSGSNGMPVTHESFNRAVFRPSNNDVENVNAQAMLAVDKGPDISEWATLQFDSASMVDSGKQFERRATELYARAGKQVRFQEPLYVKVGAGDYRNQIARLVNSPVAGLFIQVPGQDAITFHQQARAFGLSDKLKMVLDRGNEIAFLRAMKKMLPPNYWTLVFWQPELYRDVKLGREMYAAYTARTGESLAPGFLSTCSAAVFTYARAITAANGVTEPETLIGLLEGGLKVDTITGTVSYRREDHQIIGPVSYAKFVADDSDAGFKFAEGVKYDGAALLEPPSPGVAFKN